MMQASIDGIGLVSPWGESFEEFAKNYKNSHKAFTNIDRWENSNPNLKQAAMVKNFDVKKFIKPNRVGRYDIFSRLGIAATKLALQSSPHTWSEEDLSEMGIFFCCETQSSLTADYLKDLILTGPQTVSPKTFSLVSANASNCNIAIETGIKGPSVNVSAKCGSGFLSLFTGIQMLAAGHINTCAAGSIDYLSQVVFDAHAKMNSYFNNEQNSCLPGEGASTIILSSEKSGTYGRILNIAYGYSRIANYRWPTDTQTHIKILSQAIGDLSIDRIQLADNGHETVQKMEEAAIVEIFQDKNKPEIVRLKSLLGESATAPIYQLIAACCEPIGTKTLISVLSPGGLHGAFVVESSGYWSTSHES